MAACKTILRGLVVFYAQIVPAADNPSNLPSSHVPPTRPHLGFPFRRSLIVLPLAWRLPYLDGPLLKSSLPSLFHLSSGVIALAGPRRDVAAVAEHSQ